jgi:uncharacterized membrane protein YedE/YeeE
VFDTPGRLLLGLISGMIFGFLLQKGRVSKYEVIVKQFLLKDFTVMKIMLTAILVGGAGIAAFHGLGWANLHIKPALLGAILAGGAVFGLGMTLLGFCPGTGLAAAAEGNRHALWGLLGMLAGTAVYAELHATLAGGLLKAWDLGKATWPKLTGLPAGAWIALLVLLLGGALVAVERWERRSAPR